MPVRNFKVIMDPQKASTDPFIADFWIYKDRYFQSLG